MRVRTAWKTLIFTVSNIFPTHDSQLLRNLDFKQITSVLYIIVWVLSLCFDQIIDEMTSFTAGHLKLYSFQFHPSKDILNNV